MKKIITITLTASLAAAGLTGCAPGYNTPGSTVVGATAGGLIAAAAGGGAVGIIAGTLIGGGVGYAIGRDMDRQDRINMSNAIIYTPIDQQATWVNPDSHVTYEVRPIREYRYHGRTCRKYRTRVKIGHRWRTAYGTACHVPGRGWKIVR